MMRMLSAKRRRLAVIRALISRHTADVPSRFALLAAYLRTLHTTTSRRETHVLLRIKSGVYPLRMRQSDVFVLEEVLLHGQYEVRTPLGPAPTIIDAGANIGVTALWFLACYPDAAIHCFEPEPVNCSFLRSNVGAMDRVSVEQLAVGTHTSPATLYLSSHGAMHSMKAAAADAEGSLSVGCIRLEDYLVAKRIERVELLKVDVEGSELDVLNGLGERLDTVQVIVGEMHETMVDETTFYRFLTDRGFRRVRKEYYGSGKAEGVHVFEVAR